MIRPEVETLFAATRDREIKSAKARIEAYELDLESETDPEDRRWLLSRIDKMQIRIDDARNDYRLSCLEFSA